MPKRLSSHSIRNQDGFTLLEMLIVVAIILVVGSMSLLSIQSSQKNNRANMAYQTTMMQMKSARQSAIGNRTQYVVTFTLPRTIVIDKLTAGVTTRFSSIDLPNDMEFRVDPGIPTGVTLTPDGFGVGATPVDFAIDYGGGGNKLFFQPDGTVFDTLGRINNGVIYVGRPQDMLSYRAVSLYGTTGRIKGWRLSPVTNRWQ